MYKISSIGLVGRGLATTEWLCLGPRARFFRGPRAGWCSAAALHQNTHYKTLVCAPFHGGDRPNRESLPSSVTQVSLVGPYPWASSTLLAQKAPACYMYSSCQRAPFHPTTNGWRGRRRRRDTETRTGTPPRHSKQTVGAEGRGRVCVSLHQSRDGITHRAVAVLSKRGKERNPTLWALLCCVPPPGFPFSHLWFSPPTPWARV